MDFVSDSAVAGRRFRALAIVDDYSRERPAIEVDTSLGGARVVGVLERLEETRRLPEVITVDNGPEFAGKVMDEWAYRRGIKLSFIRPGKPVENAFAESFNGRLRDECLSINWFMSVKHAREIIESWRQDYNEVRPHNSLKGETPKQFVASDSTSGRGGCVIINLGRVLLNHYPRSLPLQGDPTPSFGGNVWAASCRPHGRPTGLPRSIRSPDVIETAQVMPSSSNGYIESFNDRGGAHRCPELYRLSLISKISHSTSQ